MVQLPELELAIAPWANAVITDSILSRQARLASTVDTGTVQAELDAALEGADPVAPEDEPTEVKYARALLRAAGERS